MPKLQNENGMEMTEQKSRPMSTQKCQSQSQYKNQQFKRSGTEGKNTLECIFTHCGPGKPNSIYMKTEQTNGAINQLQQPICVAILTKTVKDYYFDLLPCGPHDTQNCMENPEQAFVEYASSRTDEAGEGLVSEFMASQDARLSKFEADFKRQQVNETKVEQEEDNPGETNSSPHPQPDPLASIATKQVRKLNLMLESLGLVPQSSNTKFVYSKEDDGEVIFIEIIRDDDEPQNEDPNNGEGATTEETVVEYFDTFPNELTYHRFINEKKLGSSLEVSMDDS
ncbi:hypothetical protein Tco_0386816 [Tanacetum coccineum]